jgi:hypothetical protein
MSKSHRFLATVTTLSLIVGSSLAMPAATIAQDASASPAAMATGTVDPGSVFIFLIDQVHARGQSTPIGNIPAGTFTFEVTSEPPNAAAAYVLDPGPKGGDTITFETVAHLGGSFVGGQLWGGDVTYGSADWTVTEATGEYADLVGSHGQAYPVNAAEAGWRVLPFVVSEWGSGA